MNTIFGLTGLRFFAAMMIILFHAWPVLNKFDTGIPLRLPFSTLNDLGMSSFFVLSGFVLMHAYGGAFKSNYFLDIYNFLVARVARLFPLLFVVVSFDLIANGQYLFASLYEKKIMIDLAANILSFKSSWVYGFSGNLNGTVPFQDSIPVWSISTEFMFYLAFVPLTFIFAKVSSRLHSAFFLVSIVIFYVFSRYLYLTFPNEIFNFFSKYFVIFENKNSSIYISFVDWLFYFSPYVRFIEFLIGVALCIAFKSEFITDRIRIVTFLDGILLILLFIFLYMGRSMGVIYYFVLINITVCLVCLSMIRGSLINFICTRKFSLYFGEASYSIYLLHLFILNFVAPIGVFEATLENQFVVVGKFVVFIFLTLTMSRFTYEKFEIPAKEMVNRIFGIRRKF